MSARRLFWQHGCLRLAGLLLPMHDPWSKLAVFTIGAAFLTVAMLPFLDAPDIHHDTLGVPALCGLRARGQPCLEPFDAQNCHPQPWAAYHLSAIR